MRGYDVWHGYASLIPRVSFKYKPTSILFYGLEFNDFAVWIIICNTFKSSAITPQCRRYTIYYSTQCRRHVRSYSPGIHSGVGQHKQWFSAVGTNDSLLSNKPQALFSDVPTVLTMSLSHPAPGIPQSDPFGEFAGLSNRSSAMRIVFSRWPVQKLHIRIMRCTKQATTENIQVFSLKIEPSWKGKTNHFNVHPKASQIEEKNLFTFNGFLGKLQYKYEFKLH